MLGEDPVGAKEVKEQNQVAQSQGPIFSNDRNAEPQVKVGQNPTEK